MNRTLLFALWGGMFSICAGLGFIPEPAGLLRGLLTAAALASFVPPALLLVRSRKAGDRRTLLLVRNLSALSLGLTLLLLILNFLAAFQSEALGDLVHSMLVIVSSPMLCCGSWVLSLFLWACLLMVSLQLLEKNRLQHNP